MVKIKVSVRIDSEDLEKIASLPFNAHVESESEMIRNCCKDSLKRYLVITFSK